MIKPYPEINENILFICHIQFPFLFMTIKVFTVLTWQKKLSQKKTLKLSKKVSFLLTCTVWALSVPLSIHYPLLFQLPLRVAKAVECEKLVSSILHQDLKHSTSCRDVTSSFYHIKDLWNQMGWQEVHNNRSLLAASVDVINSFHDRCFSKDLQWCA